MTIEQKRYCANNLAAAVIEILTAENTEKSKFEIMSEFMGSKTYEKLIDFKTRLWAEGPDYIIGLYKEE